MRTLAPFLTLALVLLNGCVYEVPVTPDHSIPIDPAVLGVWQQMPEPNKEAEPDAKMLVLKYSDTEYAIRYPSGKDAMFFRGYPVKVGDLQCVQIQLIGASDQPVKDGDRKYHVAVYKLVDGVLELKILNTDVIPDKVTSSAELLKAIQANLTDPKLLGDAAKFTKVGKE